jgi:hypothetical protein
MRFGIPAYRLPRAYLAREIDRIAAMGMTFRLDHKIENLLAEQQAGKFDAVFIAIGAGVAKHVDIPARDAARVLATATLKWLSAIKEIVGPHLLVEKMALDEAGHPQPTGEYAVLEADTVVLALGQVVASSGADNICPGCEAPSDRRA